MAASFTKSRWFRAVAPWAGARYIWFCHWTSRWEHLNEEVPRTFWDADKPFIVAFWHGRMLMIRYGWRTDRPISILISRHGDGEIIARVMEKIGIRAVRGSSLSRHKKHKDRGGTAAIRAMASALEGGHCIGFTPDGPKGPRMRAKDGVVALARLTGVPIIAGTYSVRPRKVLNSWDGFVLARPFSRGVFAWGNPIFVSRDADAAALKQKVREVEETLNRITAEADRLMGQSPIEPDPIAGQSAGNKVEGSDASQTA